MTDSERLLHAIAMQRKAQARVNRAATLLRKWSAARRRMERKIGSIEVQRIVDLAHAKALYRKEQQQIKATTKRLTGGAA